MESVNISVNIVIKIVALIVTWIYKRVRFNIDKVFWCKAHYHSAENETISIKLARIS